ncbi:hypothetical protein B0H19DRAFT_1374689 [Mycena capillaripes]|nr:hypothetical protein B0H19DRAFT_1270508 [Mycena capillaripes]KAJ6564267.1 hypothetical protein B0H19DRAFT_1374689 [Mycena capillaripes]
MDTIKTRLDDAYRDFVYVAASTSRLEVTQTPTFLTLNKLSARKLENCMAMEDKVHAKLPPELERQIFELASLSWPVSIPKMMLVAWRIKYWIEPLLYRTIIFNIEPISGFPVCNLEIFDRIVRTKPASFLRDSAHSVIARRLNVDDISHILISCPSIDNLNIDGLGPFSGSLHGFDILPLTQLHCDLAGLRNLNRIDPLAAPAFMHLTHLELFWYLDHIQHTVAEEHARWTTLGTLPRLTHLALPFHTTANKTPIVAYLLDICKSLRALLVLRSAFPQAEEFEALARNDVRIVMLRPPRENSIIVWQRGILNGVDFWSRADGLIAKRHSGEVSRETFLF